MQEFFIGWNIAHRSAVVHITDIALLVNDAVQRHSTEFEQVHLLPIHLRNGMVGIGQADEGDAFIPPIALKRLVVIRTDRKNLHAAAGKFFVAISQARQRRAAIRSHEAAQEIQHDDFISAKTG